MPVTVEIEDSTPPIIIVRFIGRAEDAEIEAYQDTLNRYYDHNDAPFGVLVIFDKAESTARQRARVAERTEPYNTYLASHCFGAASVAPSIMERGILTAFFWLSPAGYPNSVFPTEALARAWLQDQARAAGA